MSVTGICPIGAIIFYTKSFAKMPTLAFQGRTEWIECNGQVVTDPASPFMSLTAPNLNSVQRFLRGASTSGTTGGADTATFQLNTGSVLAAGVAYDINTVSQSILPSYYQAVAIWRIK